MASKVKVAVLGTGSLGQHHARIYAELHAAGQVELTGIYDAHAETARKIAEQFASIADKMAADQAGAEVAVYAKFNLPYPGESPLIRELKTLGVRRLAMERLPQSPFERSDPPPRPVFHEGR